MTLQQTAQKIISRILNEAPPALNDGLITHPYSNDLFYCDGYKLTLKQWAYVAGGGILRKFRQLKSLAHNKSSIDIKDLYY